MDLAELPDIFSPVLEERRRYDKGDVNFYTGRAFGEVLQPQLFCPSQPKRTQKSGKLKIRMF